MKDLRSLFVISLSVLSSISLGGTFDYCSSVYGLQNLLIKEKTDTIENIKGKPGTMESFSLNWEKSKDSKLNLSFLLEKPAGKGGFISIKNGHFVSPTGGRFKMWGVNLSGGGCFPEKKDAPLLAAYLARFGINSVRLVLLDSNWGQERSLFNYAISTTRQLFPPQLDKLDYLIYELKKAGIYSDITLNVGRTYRKDDGVTDFEYLGYAKAVTLFDDHLIDLQKEYAKQLLTHVNPYTGNAYYNESAVSIIEIVNENSLVEVWFGGRLLGMKTTPGITTWMDIPPYYGKELTSKFNNWLKQNLTSSEIESIETEAGVKHGEDIPRLTPKEFKAASKFRFHAEARFIIQTERNFYLLMYDYLKKELNVKSMIVANSDHNHYNSGYALLSNTSFVDIVDGHVYWQHPADKTDNVTGQKYTTLLKHLKVKIENKFASVTLISIDNKPISSSGTLLLLATGRTGLTGMKWNEDRTRLIEPGKMPTTIEVIKGDITIAGLIDAKSVFVESLDGNGNPMKTISRSVKNGAVTLDIGKDVTVWYYLTIKR